MILSRYFVWKINLKVLLLIKTLKDIFLKYGCFANVTNLLCQLRITDQSLWDKFLKTSKFIHLYQVFSHSCCLVKSYQTLYITFKKKSWENELIVFCIKNQENFKKGSKKKINYLLVFYYWMQTKHNSKK